LTREHQKVTLSSMKKQIDLPEVEQVQLPHLLGLRPGIYILILLILVIALVIFFIGFYPGIVKGGRYVTFSGALSESGVLVDGTYIGATDYQYFVPSGDHTIELTKGGIVYSSYPLKINHPVFFTWLIHRTTKAPQVDLDITDAQKEAINTFNLQEIVNASAILTYDEVNKYAPLYDNLFHDIEVLQLSDAVTNKTVRTAVQYITNQTMLDDATSAFEQYPQFETTEVKQYLETAANMVKGSWSTNEVAANTEDITLTKSSLNFDDNSIVGYAYPASNFVMGENNSDTYNQSAVTVQTPNFVLSSQEINQYQWALFLEENPTWDKTNVETLIAQGLVDTSYLQGMTLSSAFVTSKPAFNISYYAAQAFCDWLSKKTGKDVFIPTEAMWSLAAQSIKDDTYATSLSPDPAIQDKPVSMLGGVWEFTQTPYVPLARLGNYTQSLQDVADLGLSADIIVKGGSYLNDPSKITTSTVGVVEPDACGELIGFRIAWYE